VTDRVRKSRYVPHRAAANLSRAISFASEIGRPLNQMVTLNYGLTYCNEEEMTAAFRRLLKSFFGKWFTRHPHVRALGGQSAAYAWVAEGRSGHHGVHWLVALPPSMLAEFKSRLPVWLERTTGPLVDAKAVHVTGAYRPRGAGDYMLKGLSPAHARRYRVRAVFQGEVYGKRCGISESLGPTAIRRHGEAVARSGLRIVG